MKLNRSAIVMGAAVAGLMGAGSLTGCSHMMTKSASVGLCKGANSCAGQSACGALKGKNSCKGQGFAMMSKNQCENLGHKWMPAPKMNM